jgi:hypothetical protein
MCPWRITLLRPFLAQSKALLQHFMYHRNGRNREIKLLKIAAKVY